MVFLGLNAKANSQKRCIKLKGIALNLIALSLAVVKLNYNKSKH